MSVKITKTNVAIELSEQELDVITGGTDKYYKDDKCCKPYHSSCGNYYDRYSYETKYCY